jgi:hypothetical protein
MSRTSTGGSQGLPLIFLDTSVLKHASDRLIRGRIHKVTRSWGDKVVTMDVTQFVDVYPNASVRRPLADELRYLPFVAHLAKTDRLRLITHQEVEFEFWGLPKTDNPRGRFYGAPIERGPDPFRYGRLIAGWPAMAKTDPQFDFVKGITHPRFQQLQQAVGTHPNSRHYKNQLLDAFHIWCAETADAEFFLTTDLKLIRHVRQHKKYPPTCHVVSPAQLVRALAADRHLRLRDILQFVMRRLHARRQPPSDNPIEELVALGKRLEKRGHFEEKTGGAKTPEP